MQHRVDGRSFRWIEENAGISRSVAHRLAQEALQELQVRTTSDVEAAVCLELARLDTAITSVMPLVIAGDMPAVDRLVRLSERRSRLLGLDAPTRLAPTTPDGKAEYGTNSIGLAGLLSEARRQLQGD
jgi:hypothetical protein